MIDSHERSINFVRKNVSQVTKLVEETIHAAVTRLSPKIFKKYRKHKIKQKITGSISHKIKIALVWINKSL